jgi:acetamidase/formamidase
VADHSVAASPETVHWGYFDASLPPILTVEPGDTVTLSTVSGSPEMMPASGFHVPPALRAIHAAMRPKLPGHICTGPVAIRGARAGQTLEVRIKAIDLHYDWGFTYSAPQKGALPDDFESMHLMHVALDPDRRIGRLPWGQTLDLKPFFGVMAVAPPASWGALSTLPPRRNGGNLDNKELVAGTILYLPIHVDGALFSVGDGHGLQGDGEVCVTAIETGLVGTFELHLRDDMALTWPMAETPTHLMTMAFDPSLDACVTIALRGMLDLVSARTGLTRQEAYGLCSLVADLRITQVVNGNKGVHVMIEKRHLQPVERR